ncbi:MAG: polysaccharide deacetylase family protein [Patescibacteria group bacterium]|nr:polysaccharide deacetylase family protein [Patescibacteria group bacterium]
MKKTAWLVFFSILIIATIIVLIAIQQKNANKPSRLSKDQEKVEKQVGESIIKINDLYANFQKEIDFVGKTATIKAKPDSADVIQYTITDVLQPINLDQAGAEEYPFLLKAEYPDGKKLVYLIIGRWNNNVLESVDQVMVGNASQVKDIHLLNDKEVIIDTTWGEGSNQEDVQLTYTFSDNKIIPDKNNIDITKAKPQKTPSPTPTPVPTQTAKNNSQSGSGKGNIALTFDDGPGVHTPEVLDVLKNHGVKATFFMIGENAESKNSYVQRVHNEGHEIGNHTYNHQDLKKLSQDAQMDEISRTNSILKNIISGLSVHWFRPPYGNYNNDTITVLDKLGMQKVLWNVDTRDWSGLSSDQITSAALSGAKNGAIILMHDGVANSGQTAKALPTIIKELKNRGYSLVKISDL